MAIGSSANPDRASFRRGRRRLALGVGAAVAAVIIALVVITIGWSGATLSRDAKALAQVKLAPFAGTVASEQAFDAHGERIALAVDHGRLTPLSKVTPGEQITVDVVISRPGWQAWALGRSHTVRLTLRAPVADVTSRWLTVSHGSPVTVSFDSPVSVVSSKLPGQSPRRVTGDPRRTISISSSTAAGTVEVAAAARPWERLSKPTDVTWFPTSSSPVVVSDPSAGSTVAPAQPIRLTFSETVADALGSKRPTITPSTGGTWRQVNSHTIQFDPAGVGADLGTELHVQLPRAVAVADAAGTISSVTNRITLTVPLGSTLRLNQLLAQEGYLPVQWTPTGTPVAATAVAETEAAVAPPAGSFSWRYPDTPSQLKSMWGASEFSEISRGAVMMFEHENNLTVDGLAGPEVWHALIEDAISGKRHEGGYTYVYVHRDATPENLTLWHAGRTILTSDANTGIEGAETKLGTYPVFEHLPEGTMEGVNPDGTPYHDTGIKWISYFDGGEAIHNFDRASFGSRQSLGCVELPLQAAAEVWPYTPIGTLVTIEE